MSIKKELTSISLNLKEIKEAQERIKLHASALNQLNPLKIGQELIVTGYSHQGKKLIADKVFVADRQGKDVEVTAQKPVSFSATGRVKKQSGELGIYSGVHEIKLSDLF